MKSLAVTAIASSACLAQVLPPSVPSRAEHPNQLAAQFHEDAVQGLTNDELIERLPLAQQEDTHNPESGTSFIDPSVIEWRWRVEGGRVSSAELGAAIRKCGVLRSSPYSYLGQNYHVWLRLPLWLRGYRIAATPRFQHNGEPVSARARLRKVGEDRCGNELLSQEAMEFHQPVGKLEPGTTQVTFDVQLEPWGATGLTGSPGPAWSGEISLPVTQIPFVPPTPLDTPDIAARVREAARVSCRNCEFRGHGEASAYLCSWFRRPLSGPLAETMVNLKLELLKDGVVINSQTIWDPDELPGPQAGWGAIRDPEVYLRNEDATNIVRREGLEHYAVRVRGVPPIVVVVWPRPHYWSGEYTLPLAEVLEPVCGGMSISVCPGK